MRHTTRVAAFTSFAATHRAGLLAAAFLMQADADRGDVLVQSTLAQLYETWPTVTDPLLFAVRQVTAADQRPPSAPWLLPDGIELVDAAPRSQPSGVLADLAGLDPDQRRVIVLTHVLQLSSATVALVVGSDENRVQRLSERALGALCVRDPARRHDRVLAEQLQAALPYRDGVSVEAAARDVAHGQLLVRRRLARTALLCTAILLVIAVGVSQLLGGTRKQPGVAAATLSPTPAAVARCDTQRASCRFDVVGDWRSQMARVSRSYVDPGGSYFSGYSYSSNELYETQGFWAGAGGVLGLDLFRLSSGGTEVYVQIATNAKFALHCGQLTRHTCVSRRFMDGNRFTLADTTYVDEGLEVQYSPRGDEVITVVARNKYRGHQLAISQAQLIALVQDERLRLPPV